MDIILPQKATKLMAYLKTKGFECFLVGGFVRDFLLRKKNLETNALDFTTNATPEQILAVFTEGKYKNKFGTVILPVAKISKELNLKPNEYAASDIFEITTYRSEFGYSDSRHPDKIIWGESIEDDLKRRDFTINAMATDGEKIIDLFFGQKDLKEKLIRTVGNPQERFQEDALRMFRAIRFSCSLDFKIEENTLMAIAKNWKKGNTLSFERIREEFLKILSSNNPVLGINLLKDTNLLQIFLPELYDSFGVSQISPKRHHIYDVGTHLLKTLENCENFDPIVRLACLIHDIGKPKTRQVTKEGIVTFYNHEIVGTDMAFKIGKRLKLSKIELTKLTKLVRYHQFLVSEEMTDKAIRRLIREVGTELIPDLIDLRTADRVGGGAKPTSWRLELFKKRLIEVQKNPFQIKDLKIDGHDVMKHFGLSPGPKVGKILKQIFQQVNENRLDNERETLLNYLSKLNV